MSVLDIPGTYNFRDLGGFATPGGTVRSGALMRSDGLLELGEAGREAVAGLGIRTAIDLREPKERRIDPPDLDGIGVDVHHVPVINGLFKSRHGVHLEEIYEAILAERGAQIAKVVALLSRPGALPAVYFCSAGKDRTGLVSALTLSAVGASDEDVIEDYALTETLMKGEFRAKLVARAVAAGFSEQTVAVNLGSPPSLMRAMLADLRARFGGSEGYLLQHGLAASELEALRATLVSA